MRKLQNDGISTDEEGILEEDYDSLRGGADDEKLDIESFSDEEEADQY